MLFQHSATTTGCKKTISRTLIGDQTVWSFDTWCCKAAFTGTIYGTACKGCGRQLSEAESVEAVTFAGLEKMLAESGCPCPEDCAFSTEWALDQQVPA